MRITVNDEQVTIDEPCSVTDLLRRYNLGTTACAVEVNRSLVPKREHDAHELQDGDAVEIVTLVGGG
jgi:sulfur carrier protein